MGHSGAVLTLTRKGSWEYEVVSDGHLFYAYRNPKLGWEVFKEQPVRADSISQLHRWVPIHGTTEADRIIQSVMNRETGTAK